MMLSLLLYVVGLLYGCLVIPTMYWSLLWVLGIHSSHRNTLDPWGDGGCCSAFAVRAVAAEQYKRKISLSISQLESLDNIQRFICLPSKELAGSHILVRLCELPVVLTLLEDC